MMNARRPTELPDVVVLETRTFQDARGHFRETWHEARYAEHGISLPFVQDNVSFSKRGVLRGLHMQVPHAQGKLVAVLQGEVLDVAIDVRLGSPTFARVFTETLSATNGRHMYVPPGFLHGFCVTSDSALLTYKCTDFYMPQVELGVRWDDPDLAIPWPVRWPLLSPKDAALPRLRDIPTSKLPRYSPKTT
jgi:dTDP-4-dehydrorhamnose 3,5-epimerase